MGYDLGYKSNYDYIQEKVTSYFDKVHNVGSVIDGKEIIIDKHSNDGFCPAKNAQKFSSTSNAVEGEIKAAIDSSSNEFENWTSLSVGQRANILEKIAQSFEDNKFELYAILIKEAGKSIHDAINEVIEAIDFCRYYANEARVIMAERKLPGATGERNTLSMHGLVYFYVLAHGTSHLQFSLVKLLLLLFLAIPSLPNLLHKHLWEKLPFNHSIWHLFVLGGSTSHYFSIYSLLAIEV